MDKTDFCICGHKRDQHALYSEKCGNCGCRKFRWGASEDAPVVVGIESHEFQGTSALCNGVLGYSAASPHHGEICNLPKDAAIHKGIVSPSGLKDSGERLQFASGMVRDIDNDKPAFDLVIPEGIPYKEHMLTRWAELLRKGAIKYSRRNWEKADSKDELDRAKASAFRHFMQWFSGETDEDHAAAVFFNITEAETIKWKQANQKKEV